MVRAGCESATPRVPEGVPPGAGAPGPALASVSLRGGVGRMAVSVLLAFLEYVYAAAAQAMEQSGYQITEENAENEHLILRTTM